MSSDHFDCLFEKPQMRTTQPEGSVPHEIALRIQLFLRLMYSEHPCLISKFQDEYKNHTGRCISPQMYGFKENAWEEMFRHISTVEVNTLLGHPSVSAIPPRSSLAHHLFYTLDNCNFFEYNNFDYMDICGDGDKFRSSEELFASLMNVAQNGLNLKYNNKEEEHHELFPVDIPKTGTACRSYSVDPGFEINSSVSIPDTSSFEETSILEPLSPPNEFNDQVLTCDEFELGIDENPFNSDPAQNSENQEHPSPAVEITDETLALASQLLDQNDIFSQENDGEMCVETNRQIVEADIIVGHRLRILNQMNTSSMEVEARNEEEYNPQNRVKRQMNSPVLDSPAKRVMVKEDFISHLGSSPTTSAFSILSPLSMPTLASPVSFQVNESSDDDDLADFHGRSPLSPADEDNADANTINIGPCISNSYVLNHGFSEFFNFQGSLLEVEVGDTTIEVLPSDIMPAHLMSTTPSEHEQNWDSETVSVHNLRSSNFPLDFEPRSSALVDTISLNSQNALNIDRCGVGDEDEHFTENNQPIVGDTYCYERSQQCELFWRRGIGATAGILDKVEKRICGNPRKRAVSFSQSHPLHNPDLWKCLFSSGYENRFIIVACGDGDYSCVCKRANKSWQQLDDLHLPRETILYAEIIRTSGSQIEIINIIDAAFVDGKDIQSLKFKERRTKCQKFSAKMNLETTTTHFTCLSAVDMGKVSDAFKKLAKSNGSFSLADGLGFKPTEILFLKVRNGKGSNYSDFQSTMKNLVYWEWEKTPKTFPKWGTGSFQLSDECLGSSLLIEYLEKNGKPVKRGGAVPKSSRLR